MELYHHGIKGQQWGVRNGPPYPIEQDHKTIIKKGTKFHRLSIRDESEAKGHAYVTYLKGDTEHYKGFFSLRLKKNSGKGANVQTITMEAKKDLISPSKKERVDTFVSLYKKDPVLRKELGDYYKEDWHNVTPLPKKFYEWKISNLKGSDITKKGYNTFIRSIGGNEYIRSKYFKELSRKGYSFVTDDMDAGRFGKAPSIIFEREKSVEYKGQKNVSMKEAFDILKRRGIYYKEKDKR